MRRLSIIFGLFGVLALTSGCAQMVAGAANQVAVAAVDQKLSQVLERDCNSYRFIRGGEYCERRAAPDPGPEIYCFKTLGGIDCHRKPDPYEVSGAGRTVEPQALQSPSYDVVKQQAEERRAEEKSERRARTLPVEPEEEEPYMLRKPAPQQISDRPKI